MSSRSFILIFFFFFNPSFAHVVVNKAGTYACAYSPNTCSSEIITIADTLFPPQPPIINIYFSGRVFLQGAYDPLAEKMKNTLNVSGVLDNYANAQPYNTNTAGYMGSEKVAHGFFTAHPNIVDWVLVEISSTAYPFFKLQRAVFVKTDGTLVDIDGHNTNIIFKEVAGGFYNITIKHRNHLGIKSRLPIDFTSGAATYDFTTSSGQSFQTQSYTSTIQVGGIWAMRGGNANSNANIKYNGPVNDQDQIQNGLFGSLALILNDVYSSSDVNMDGKVRASGPSNDQNFLLNSILEGSIGLVYVEQL